MKKNDKYNLLRNLLPAALTGLLIACASSAMKPALASVPALLEYTPPEESKTAEKPKLKDTESISKLVKEEKKTKVQSTSETFADQDSYKDGVYTGSAQGFGGQITVEVTVTGGRISTVTILSAPGETEPYFSMARSVIEQIISTGSPNVDTVSGATYSSNGILNAVKRALAEAGGSGNSTISELPAPAVDSSPANLEPETVDPSAIPANPDQTLKDGSYSGSARGFGGNIVVSVQISGGKIAGITVVSASGETASYFNRARSVISSILAAQSADVDSVSGATYSSMGIKNAVKNAIAKAVTDPSSDPQSPSDEKEEEPDTPDSNDNEEEKENPDMQKKDPSEISKKPVKELKDGVYKGTGEGFGGEIELEITIKEGKIVQVKIISAEAETAGYFNKAKGLLPDILEEQSADLDVVSGATYSSEGILEALEDAMKQAEITKEEESGEEIPGEEIPGEDTPEKEVGKYHDGIFSAQTLCTDAEDDPEDFMFYYTVKLDITIEDGKITDVSAVKTEDHSEDPDDNETYFNNAVNGRTRKGIFYQGLIPQILEKQSADDLDIVSSATYTSNAIIQAAREALETAKGQEEL